MKKMAMMAMITMMTTMMMITTSMSMAFWHGPQQVQH